MEKEQSRKLMELDLELTACRKAIELHENEAVESAEWSEKDMKLREQAHRKWVEYQENGGVCR